MSLLRFGLSRAIIDVGRSSDLPFDFHPLHSMAKKPQGTAPPNPHNVPNRDIMQRLNFLYQAGTYLSSLSAIKGGATPTTRPGEQTGELPLATPAYLSRAYINSMKTIGRKTVVKLWVRFIPIRLKVVTCRTL